MAFNPELGSTSPAVLLDNAERLDKLVNGPAADVPDRGGDPDDIDGDLILIRKQGHLKELRVKSTPPVEAMIARRRERYPEDVFLFQSHSNRVKYQRRPVTIIAFNAALRRAARSLPDVNVSSSSARNIPD
ncbi:hypothetical protein [Klebsiella pneumoniae]|uniref:hypothetical protein n=1 Tax=Klebsiella pneumoniae TaxID=573 RepID=UPI0039869B39